LKELTEETAENASSYTKKEWKEMASELKKINAKLSNACKDLTDEQIREIKKLKKKLKKELADFDGDKLKEDLEEISIQVCETLEEILSE
jgi:uncharacterized protein YpuA (DUF1002 family)